jgi:predicted transcriptional regulator
MLNITIDIDKLKEELSKRLLRATYEEIAKKTGFSRQFLYKIMKGQIQQQPKSYRRLRTIYTLCKKLHIKSDAIIRQNNENEPELLY